MKTSILPLPFADAIHRHEFIPAGTLNARRLYDTPQIAYLKKKHGVEVEVDDMAWALIQRAILQILRDSNPKYRVEYAMSVVAEALRESWKEASEHYLAIEKLLPQEESEWIINQTMALQIGDVNFTTFEGTDKEHLWGRKNASVFGDIPLYHIPTKTLYYFQVCNTLSWTKQELRKTWLNEANVLAQILRGNDHEVEKIECLMIFKDWSRGRADANDPNNPTYPTKQVATLALSVYKPESVMKFIKARAIQHLKTSEGDVPPCTDVDRWKEADMWKVCNPVKDNPEKFITVTGGKFFTQEDATLFLSKNKHKLTNAVIRRETGEYKRCTSYCPVRDHCQQNLQ